MKHTWLVGILAGVLLAGSAVGSAAANAGARCRPRETVLGTVTIPRGGTADGKPLARGQYTVRLTAQAAQPTVAGQLPDLNRWVEFVQGGQVKGREVVSIVPADEVKQTAAGAGPRYRHARRARHQGRDAQGRRIPARLDRRGRESSI